MAMRIPWDENEAAILLDASLAVVNNEISREDAVLMVSRTLRERAIRSGKSIDSVYRNENGISMQMSIMMALILETSSGLHGASKLFKDIVYLYKNNYERFQKLLKEANKEETVMLEIKENFYMWLDSSVRPSEVLSVKKLCDLVDTYSKDNIRLGYSLFEIKQLDDVYRIKKAVEKDVFFRARNGRKIQKIEKALDEYIRFIRKYISNNTEVLIPKEKKGDEVYPCGDGVSTSNVGPDTYDKDNFYNYLVNNVGVAVSTGRSYTSQINTCEIYAIEHGVGTGKLYHAMDNSEACETAQLLMNDAMFLEFSKKSHNAPIAALRKYYEYLTGTINKREKKPSVVEEDFLNVDFERYKKILFMDYKKGFRLNDKLSIRRFRMQWQSTFQDELQYEDETVCNHIAHITIRHGDMAYLPEVMLDEDTKCRLLEYINTLFSEGKSAIYYEALYHEFADDFAVGRINNVEMLKTYLSYINDGSMYIRRSYIASDSNVEVDNAEEVRCFLIAQGMPVQVDDIIFSLPHIAKDKILRVIAGPNSDEFVRNHKGEYLHTDIVEFTQHETDLIIEWISTAIADKEYMGGKELTDTIQKKLPSIKERYPYLTSLGLRDVIAYKLKDMFSFKGKIISAYGEDLSMTDVFANFAKTHEHFTLAQLDMLKNDLDTPIYFDSVYANSLRINKEYFVSKNQARFDIDATDAAIEQFCYDDFISIKDISLFGGFPDAYFSWNHFLLQHYVANYSKKYKLLHGGFTANKPVGAIVKRSSRIETFDDVIARALAESNIPLDSDNALQYLYDAGYIARRSYVSLDAILVKANMYRTNKGE